MYKTHNQYQPVREKFISAYNSQVILHHWGKSGQELKNEQRQEAWSYAAYWLALHGLPHYLFHIFQFMSPRVVLPTVNCAPHINRQSEKCYKDMSTGQSDSAIASIEVLFPKMTLHCVKLTNLISIHPRVQCGERSMNTYILSVQYHWDPVLACACHSYILI